MSSWGALVTLLSVPLAGALVTAGCATTAERREPAPQQLVPLASNGAAAPSFTSFSSLASRSAGDDDDEGARSLRGGKGLSVPHRGVGRDGVELLVSPDAFTAEFAVREVRPTLDAALSAAQTTHAAMATELARLTGGASTSRLRGTSVARVVRKQEPDQVSVTVDGLIEVKIPADADFWARSRLYALLLDAGARLSVWVRSGGEPLRALTIEEFQPVVLDLESHRPELLERWIARARAFAQLAQSKDVPLALVDCAAPAAITVTRASLAEVALQLAVSCRVDTAAHPERAARF